MRARGVAFNRSAHGRAPRGMPGADDRRTDQPTLTSTLPVDDPNRIGPAPASVIGAHFGAPVRMSIQPLVQRAFDTAVLHIAFGQPRVAMRSKGRACRENASSSPIRNTAIGLSTRQQQRRQVHFFGEASRARRADATSGQCQLRSCLSSLASVSDRCGEQGLHTRSVIDGQAALTGSAARRRRTHDLVVVLARLIHIRFTIRARLDHNVIAFRLDHAVASPRRSRSRPDVMCQQVTTLAMLLVDILALRSDTTRSRSIFLLSQ